MSGQKETGKKESNTQGHGGVVTRSSDLEKRSSTLANQETSESLPKSVSLQLLELMQKVVSDEVNPQTVGAACKCASEIHKMLRLNLDMSKSGF